MLINSPLPRGGFGILREGSPQRSLRDADGVGNAWKTTNRSVPNLAAVQNVLSQHTRDINRLRKRIPTFIQQPQNFFPFKIYNIGNASATPTQIAQYTGLVVSGNPTPVDINNYTYQVRSGIIGCRSLLTQSTTNDGYQFSPSGNYELPVYCPNTDDIGTNATFFDQPSSNTGSGVILNTTAATLIWDDSAASTTFFNQIFLNPNPDDLGFAYAAFWIQVIENNTNGAYPPLYTQLWGRMWTQNAGDSTGRTLTAFPSGYNIYPIGWVSRQIPLPIIGGFNQNYNYQLITSNLVGRYPSDEAVYAGLWTADSLSGDVFYNGTIVVDDTTPITIGATTYYKAYSYIGGFGQETVPPIAGTKWKYMFSQIN